MCGAMCGRWLGKHGVNVQKGASFLLASFSNPDSFFWKVFHPLPLKKTKKQIPTRLLCVISANWHHFQLSTIISPFYHRCLTPRALSPYSKLAPCSGFFLLFSHTWNRQANYSLCGSQGESQPNARRFMSNGQHGAGGPEAVRTVATWPSVM